MILFRRFLQTRPVLRAAPASIEGRARALKANLALDAARHAIRTHKIAQTMEDGWLRRGQLPPHDSITKLVQSAKSLSHLTGPIREVLYCQRHLKRPPTEEHSAAFIVQAIRLWEGEARKVSSSIVQLIREMLSVEWNHLLLLTPPVLAASLEAIQEKEASAAWFIAGLELIELAYQYSPVMPDVEISRVALAFLSSSRWRDLEDVLDIRMECWSNALLDCLKDKEQLSALRGEARRLAWTSGTLDKLEEIFK